MTNVIAVSANTSAGPHGMFIVLAGQKEREALLTESLALVEEVERAIGFR